MEAVNCNLKLRDCIFNLFKVAEYQGCISLLVSESSAVVLGFLSNNLFASCLVGSVYAWSLALAVILLKEMPPHFLLSVQLYH